MNLNDKHSGLLIVNDPPIADRASKDMAQDDGIYGWKQHEFTLDEWIDQLERGNTVQIGNFVPRGDGKFSHKKEFWRGTHFIACDADNIKGVEKLSNGNEKNPHGLEPWTEKNGLSTRYPELREKVFAVGQSVSSMLRDPHHRRYRLVFVFDELITSIAHYNNIVISLAELFPIIPAVERSPAQPIFGNARDGYSKFSRPRNILKLADFPMPVVGTETGGVRPGAVNDDRRSQPAQGVQVEALQEFLTEHGIKWTYEDGKHFVKCPYSEGHTDGICKEKDAYLFVREEDGKFAYACSHDSCKQAGNNTFSAFKKGYGIKTKGRPKSAATLLRELSPYFDGNQFLPTQMRDAILEKWFVWTLNGRILLYDEDSGIYQEGEADVERFIRDELGDLVTNYIVKEVISEVQSFTRMVEPATNANLIAFRNGILNFETFELLPHSHENYLLSSFDVDWLPELSDEDSEVAMPFVQFMVDIVPEDSFDLLLASIGSIFHKQSTDEQAVFLWLGGGSNGKSLLLKSIQNIIGKKNYSSVQWPDYNNVHNIHYIYQRSLVCDDDLKYDEPVPAFIKGASTGVTELTHNEKYKQTFDFSPFCTWLALSNDLPSTRDRSFGFLRRWKIIQFPHKFEEDSNFQREILALSQKEVVQSLIVASCITEYREQRKTGGFAMPQSSRDLLSEYEKEIDTVLNWFDDNCELDTNSYEPKQVAYDDYRQWCEENGRRSTSKIIFGKRLNTMEGVKSVKKQEGGVRTHVYEGFKLFYQGEKLD